ncbi:MaoC family dehydratase [Alicyclobacillus dauci]|uniref:MaoC family dehydratase n=1 Tax=Alicyclobacillus dauci TaxID=1475485 RepID=A0ABY6Z0C7_9BACL|nr:MaoC family dehydratase [Alicyclobacillus dauci]WAH36205.1 MaoC family dehydratase [Alicyclobacillus dauci]
MSELLRDYQVGDTILGSDKNVVTKVQIVKYAGASKDFTPIHIDEEFAEQAGLGGVIAHGMLTMGVLSNFVEQVAAEEADVVQMKVRFKAMVRPGDEIVSRAVIKEKVGNLITLDLETIKGDEKVVLAGEAVLRQKA